MECLLSYIEITQYQKYLINKMDECQCNDIPEIKLINFPSSVPISAIIDQNEEKMDDNNMDNKKFVIYCAKLKAHKLYEKYVGFDSELQMNISAKMKKPLDDILSDIKILINCNINLSDLLLLFEDSKLEMYQLLTYSFDRFKANKSEFNQIIEIFQKNRKSI